MAPVASRGATPTTIDEYLAGVSSDKRAALQRLRKQIHACAPGVEECISYQMPGFRLNGRMLVWFGAGANHCAFYPGGIAQAFKKDLAGFEISKGTIRFQPDAPIPSRIIRRIVKARIAADAAKRSARRATKGRARATAKQRR